MKADNWLSPRNKLILRDAVNKRAAEVTLHGGRKFTMEYTKGKAGTTQAGEDFVTLRPCEGIVPRGTIKIATMMDNLWLEFAGDRRDM
jgi:hypothetical protein